MWYTGSYNVCMYPKDKIIVNRDCHQSVINTLILGDIEPAYIYPQIDNKTNIINGDKRLKML